MVSNLERIENMTLRRDFPWGLMVEVLENFSLRQLIIFQENADPAPLPLLLASCLKESDVINVKDLTFLVEKLPTMFENPKFLRNLPKTMKIEISK